MDGVVLTAELHVLKIVYVSDYQVKYKWDFDITTEQRDYLYGFTSEQLKLELEKETFPYKEIKEHYRRCLAYIRLRL